MNKLLVITVLVALLSLSAESFRMPRQAEAVEEEEEVGTLTKVSGTIKSYYNDAVNTASGYLDSIRGLKIEEKAKNFYTEATSVITTYAGIFNDQIYHMLYQK
ncbi:apolipoprotein C-II [Epinephelus fuscoguttatus]|uniref:apolipoprotein C-II n=1 Tax=Epinephelus fuscoguttatus TaxID=293821 RepID=UPI0020D11AB9|nr:apolipoprotein C-II [Epinephelus fuscoguttatus]